MVESSHGPVVKSHWSQWEAQENQVDWKPWTAQKMNIPGKLIILNLSTTAFAIAHLQPRQDPKFSSCGAPRLVIAARQGDDLSSVSNGFPMISPSNGRVPKCHPAQLMVSLPKKYPGTHYGPKTAVQRPWHGRSVSCFLRFILLAKVIIVFVVESSWQCFHVLPFRPSAPSLGSPNQDG